MARKTKAPTRRPATKKKPATARPKAAQKRSAGARKGAARGTEVERNWATYLAQRSSLEQAVAAVRAAETQLTSAREIEAARRKEFDDSKQALEQLLEVDPATSRPSPQRKPLDFPLPARKPASGADQEATRG